MHFHTPNAPHSPASQRGSQYRRFIPLEVHHPLSIEDVVTERHLCNGFTTCFKIDPLSTASAVACSANARTLSGSFSSDDQACQTRRRDPEPLPSPPARKETWQCSEAVSRSVLDISWSHPERPDLSSFENSRPCQNSLARRLVQQGFR